jgi:hypothetical protein
MLISGKFGDTTHPAIIRAFYALFALDYIWLEAQVFLFLTTGRAVKPFIFLQLVQSVVEFLLGLTKYFTSAQEANPGARSGPADPTPGEDDGIKAAGEDGAAPFQVDLLPLIGIGAIGALLFAPEATVKAAGTIVNSVFSFLKELVPKPGKAKAKAKARVPKAKRARGRPVDVDKWIKEFDAAKGRGDGKGMEKAVQKLKQAKDQGQFVPPDILAL